MLLGICQDVKDEIRGLSLIFPSPKKDKDSKDEPEDVPEEYQIYKSLYILFKGDYQKMEWFYENKTEADLMLMTLMRNNTQEYFNTGLF
jgi:hypothetical protein